MIPLELEAAGFELPEVLTARLQGWKSHTYRRLRGREFLSLHERLNARTERVLLPFAIRRDGTRIVACLEVIPTTHRLVLCDRHGRVHEEHPSLAAWLEQSADPAPWRRLVAGGAR